jgi:molybdopterin-guanine dinucleotide biosynthesis protein A
MVDRSGIILAGGFSSRFDQDKATLDLNGKPLLRHVVDAIKTFVDELIVVTDSQERAEEYEKLVGPKVRFAVDVQEAKGPLVGAYTGFEAAQGKYSLLLAVDLPFVSRDVAELLFELCPGRSAVIPRWPNQQIEPLHAVYHTKTALEAARIALSEDLLNVPAMIEHLGGVRYVSTLVIQELNPELTTFFNVNSPLDLSRAKSLLGKKPTKKSK